MGALGILLWNFEMIGSGHFSPRYVEMWLSVRPSYDIMLLFFYFMSMLDLLFVVLKYDAWKFVEKLLSQALYPSFDCERTLKSDRSF